jgi:hypothetical protein
MGHLPFVKRSGCADCGWETSSDFPEHWGAIYTSKDGRESPNLVYKLGKLCVYSLLSGHAYNFRVAANDYYRRSTVAGVAVSFISQQNHTLVMYNVTDSKQQLARKSTSITVGSVGRRSFSIRYRVQSLSPDSAGRSCHESPNIPMSPDAETTSYAETWIPQSMRVVVMPLERTLQRRFPGHIPQRFLPHDSDLLHADRNLSHHGARGIRRPIIRQHVSILQRYSLLLLHLGSRLQQGGFRRIFLHPAARKLAQTTLFPSPGDGNLLLHYDLE